MRTFSQTFSAATTWKMHISGKYFTLLSSTLDCTIRFYKAGKILDLGEINSVQAGIEVFDNMIPDGGSLFDSIEIDIGGAATVKIGIGNGQARNSAGAVTVSGTVQVSGTFWQATQPVSFAATLGVTDKGVAFASSYKSLTGMAANTPDTIVAPGSNTNGVLLSSGFMHSGPSSVGLMNFLAKASAPTTVIDGHPLLTPLFAWGATNFIAKLNQPIFIPAGLGIYAISAAAESGGTVYRGALYTVL